MTAELLGRCTDVPGVLGAFALDGFGRVTSSRLPTFFAESSVVNAGPRIGLLVEASLEAMSDLDDLHLVFEGFGLWIRRRPTLSLVLIAAVDAKPDMLRLASSQLARLLEESARSAPVPTLISRLEMPGAAPYAAPPSGRVAPSAPASKPAAPAAPPKPKKKNDIWGD